MLLAKTLTSSTFKLALIAIGTFGVIVSAIFSYVYLSTSSYVRSRSDRAIMTEYSSLQGAYERSGRDGLIAADSAAHRRQKFCRQCVYPRRPFIGRLWPATSRHGHRRSRQPADGQSFARSEPLPDATNRPLLRAMLETFPSGDRLLVGRDISDLDSFTDQIKTAVISGVALIFVLAGVASILVTRRTVGRIE